MTRIRAQFEQTASNPCPGEADCQIFQSASEDCLWEQAGEIHQIGQYQACMMCVKLPSKPLVQLERMAQIVPRSDLQQYLSEQASAELADHTEWLIEQHNAGWPVEVGALQPWEARLFVFWQTTWRRFEEAQQAVRASNLEQLLKALLTRG